MGATRRYSPWRIRGVTLDGGNVADTGILGVFFNPKEARRAYWREPIARRKASRMRFCRIGARPKSHCLFVCRFGAIGGGDGVEIVLFVVDVVNFSAPQEETPFGAAFAARDAPNGDGEVAFVGEFDAYAVGVGEDDSGGCEAGTGIEGEGAVAFSGGFEDGNLGEREGDDACVVGDERDETFVLCDGGVNDGIAEVESHVDASVCGRDGVEE